MNASMYTKVNVCKGLAKVHIGSWTNAYKEYHTIFSKLLTLKFLIYLSGKPTHITRSTLMAKDLIIGQGYPGIDDGLIFNI